ncbi:GlxA family transcriptional regulator [Chromohalobacter sp. 48-RD10]|uniref:GlxA family transcriptional regulator n=1 Tax=Chromohalobacter sp. 48-RD10 TaxID=2994063 RepID=UPI0024690596|nr:GlxA family transcriptional regulator [Chromohalobacter sp. 48-RD10]
MSENTRTDWPYPRPEQPPVPNPGDAAHTVNVWLVPNFSMLTLFCLLEPLRVSNRFGRELFAWRLLSADGEAVVASNGVRIEVEGVLAEHTPGDLLMVISSYEAEVSVTGAERAVLRHVAAHGGRVGGLDTGPFILARAGLLDQHRVALHWESVPAFRAEFPHISVSEARFEFAGQRLTGSGGAAGIDMMLQWIEHDYGPALANAVGRQLVHQRVSEEEAWRAGAARTLEDLPRSVVRALAVMETHLDQVLSIPEICRLIGQSQRQLTRLFVAHFGETPKQCYVGMRLDYARRLLADSRCRVTEAALTSGFAHLAHFSRVYQARFGERPSATAERGTV